ncbi:MAG: Asp23/Gls24 family envelope stress response protein [Oscillospiraceae bacterium]|nr:Asp23/Gls24 family envelope stress response protein [Oscillospiraceae bacterium]
MAENKDGIIKLEEHGTVRISEEVVAAIASQAAMEVDGVMLMTASGSGVSDLVGKKNFKKGIKITLEENRVSADIFLLTVYGKQIPALAQKVQDRVTSSLQSMTGLTVGAVNIHVGGVVFEKEKGAKGS